jgi:hypothetical protein
MTSRIKLLKLSMTVHFKPSQMRFPTENDVRENNLADGGNSRALLLGNRWGENINYNREKCTQWIFAAEKESLLSRAQCDRGLMATLSYCSTVTVLCMIDTSQELQLSRCLPTSPFEDNKNMDLKEIEYKHGNEPPDSIK